MSEPIKCEAVADSFPTRLRFTQGKYCNKDAVRTSSHGFHFCEKHYGGLIEVMAAKRAEEMVDQTG